MSFLHILSCFSYEMMLANAEDKTFILLKGALFETSFHNDRLFIYRNNTTYLKKKNSSGTKVWVILYLVNSSATLGLDSRGSQTPSNQWVHGQLVCKLLQQFSLWILCLMEACLGGLGSKLYPEGWRGFWQLPRQVIFSSLITSYCLLLCLSLSSLSLSSLWLSRLIICSALCHIDPKLCYMTQSLGWSD